MGDDGPRAVLLGSLRLQQGLAAPSIAALFSGEGFAPEKLNDDEARRLAEGNLANAPPHVAGDVPEWVLPQLEAILGADLLPELKALARRAPLDIRVNALKGDRAAAMPGLAHHAAAAA